ncbi:MAG: DUF305 domain-containing protein [Longimicrobiales bacterium]
MSRRTIFSSSVVGLLLACSAGVTDPGGVDEPAEPVDLSPYFITPVLCGDSEGPNCESLRLGDDHLTTTAPARGKLYSCSTGNPNAPGSDPTRISWIDRAAGSWNLLAKPFLPAGSFAPGPGQANLSESGGIRSITVNNLPVDGMIGDWPMTAYPLLSAIDRNPGIPAATTITFRLPVDPVVGATPACTSLGAIGVTLNGVVLYNAVDARGNDAVAHEIVDEFGGHPAMSDYHYHFLPERLDAEPMSDGHSGLTGYIRDGFGLYGYKGIGGIELTNDDLDECHGHDHPPMGYHYHATLEYPYTVGCYRGVPEAAFAVAGPALRSPEMVVPDAKMLAPFLRRMILHHAQALELAALTSGRTHNEGVRRLAERIMISQSEEIRFMESWLRGVAASGAPDTPEHAMPGMLPAERIERLGGTSGGTFDRLFLEAMMEHHRGAIEMARVYRDHSESSSMGAAAEWFVLHVEAEQAAESARMREMLKSLP